MKFFISPPANQLRTTKLRLKALRELRTNKPLMQRWQAYNRILKTN